MTISNWQRLLVSAGIAFSGMATAQTVNDRANFAKHQLATGTTFVDTHSALYLTDGKAGPENRWLSTNRGRHRISVFFESPVTLGSMHLYSFAYEGPPIADFELFYVNESGSFVSVPGSAVTGNNDEAISIVFSAPITTQQFQVRIEDQTARVDEIALFPPNGGLGYPLGTDVNLHQGRQHRLAFTPASSRATGTMRRSIVDGFVNDLDVWRTSQTGPHWIELDMTDPPETTPADVRVANTPLRLGSVHLYSGLESGTGVISSGRFQRFENGVGWSDIAGSSFSGNTQGFLAIEFDGVIETSRIRLVVDDSSQVVVREIVPLPPVVDGQMWREGTSVTFAPEADYRTLDDHFYSIDSVVNGASLTGESSGDVFAGPNAGVLSQQYQVLYHVGTDTYRIRSRATGDCLAVAGASQSVGASIIETSYSALPHQQWRLVEASGGYQFINAYSNLALAMSEDDLGAPIVQALPQIGDLMQIFTLDQRANFPKKGHGGFPQEASVFQPAWAYNWGKEDTFPDEVNYWPMQWGSFFWNEWPELVPQWNRVDEPMLLMGYNEPDGVEQSDIPVPVAIDMWPRLEATNFPLLGPAPVGATNSWITGFMNGVDDRELRVEYVAVHNYGGPNPDGLINQIQNAHNAFGRDVMLTEFSTVDWNNTNNWADEDTFNFFAEAFWRLENLPILRRYAVFIFTDDPTNPISDNRGEMRNADGSMTPEGVLFAAWDGDTTIRSDTPYHLHNEASIRRVGAIDAGSPQDSVVIGTRFDIGEDFTWYLIPTDENNVFRVASAADGRQLAFSSRGLVLQDADQIGESGKFRLVEAEHGWFYLQETLLDRRLESNPSLGGALDLATPNTTGAEVRWRFLPVLNAPPAAPRDLAAEVVSLGTVSLDWDTSRFRDLLGSNIYRTGPDGTRLLIASSVIPSSFQDQVPQPGTYAYEVTMVGDTGESAGSSVMVVVDTCPADFDGDLDRDSDDVSAALVAIGSGLDYNADGQNDFFDTIDFLRVYDDGCQ